MRKSVFIIFLLIFTGALMACSQFNEKSNYDASQQSNDVTLSIKEKNITPKTESIILVYINHSNKQYMYGEEPYLEVKVDDTWYVVPMLETAGWTDIGYLLFPNKTNESEFFIKNNYGQLNKGSYRIIKKLNLETKENSKGGDIFSIVEFQVE